jgi:hypothetical protein
MRRLGLLVCLLWTVLAVSSVSAQTVFPILAIASGHLLRQNAEAMEAYTQCQPPDEGLLSTLIQSPNNRYILMETQPEMVRQAILIYGGLGGGTLPSNLWMCDTEANTLVKIGAQPANASFMAGDIPDSATIRSAPTWSPDGAQVAWVEQTYPQTNYSLMIYTLAQNTIIQVPLLGLPVPVGPTTPYPVMWGDAGLMLMVYTLDEFTYVTTETLYLFDNNGQYLRQTFIGSAGENDDVINERILIRHEDREYLGLAYARAGWVLMDILTGAKQPMPGIPELYSRTAPSGLTLDVKLTPDEGYVWHISDRSEETTLTNLSRQRLSLSPDGSRIAYGTDQIRIWVGGQQLALAGSADFEDDPTASLVWSAMAWRVRPDANVIATLTAQPQAQPTVIAQVVIQVTATSATVQLIPTATPNLCAGLLAPRLQVGQQGRVTLGGVPNNVRETPAIGARKVGQIAPGGGAFNILEGPVCADGYVWYRVRMGTTLEGWTAEGGNNEYWIEPMQ